MSGAYSFLRLRSVIIIIMLTVGSINVSTKNNVSYWSGSRPLASVFAGRDKSGIQNTDICDISKSMDQLRGRFIGRGHARGIFVVLGPLPLPSGPRTMFSCARSTTVDKGCLGHDQRPKIELFVHLEYGVE